MLEAYDIYQQIPVFLDSAERSAALIENVYQMGIKAGESKVYPNTADNPIMIFYRLSEYNYKDSDKRMTYYRIMLDEQSALEANHAYVLRYVGKCYAELGDYLDCEKRAAAAEKKANEILDDAYKAAAALKRDGKYEEAITAFTAIESHKDSAEQITACQTAILDGKYDAAIALMNDGKYTDSIAAFTEIKDYKDSADQIKACETAILDGKYNAAVELMNDGKYSESIAAFTEIQSHRDSVELIEVCEIAILDDKYNAAIALKDAGKYTDAYISFVALDGYKDSKDQLYEILISHPKAIYLAVKVGDYVTFGAYEQDNDTSNGKEDIEWLVLAKENNRMLIISRYALDCKPYNTEYTSVTWATCTLRNWLNKDFLNTAFSSVEQAMIPTVTVSADRNPLYNTNPGNATQDKVYLLSITEGNKYFNADSEGQCKPTAYAEAQGAWTDESGWCWWWLRSPGNLQSYVTGISHIGGVRYLGRLASYDRNAVRPALWINLEP